MATFAAVCLIVWALRNMVEKGPEAVMRAVRREPAPKSKVKAAASRASATPANPGRAYEATRVAAGATGRGVRDVLAGVRDGLRDAFDEGLDGAPGWTREHAPDFLRRRRPAWVESTLADPPLPTAAPPVEIPEQREPEFLPPPERLGDPAPAREPVSRRPEATEPNPPIEQPEEESEPAGEPLATVHPIRPEFDFFGGDPMSEVTSLDGGIRYFTQTNQTCDENVANLEIVASTLAPYLSNDAQTTGLIGQMQELYGQISALAPQVVASLQAHQPMAEAVGATPQAANDTQFYRPE